MTQDPKVVLYLLILAEYQTVTCTKNTNKFFKHFTILRPEQGLLKVFSVTSIFFCYIIVFWQRILVYMEQM